MALKGYLIEKYNVMSNAYTCNRLAAEAAARDVNLQIVGIHDTIVTPDGIFNHGVRLEPVDFVINRYKWGRAKDAINALAPRSYNPLSAYNVYINKFEQVQRLHSEAFLMPKYLLGTSLLPFASLVEQLGLPFVGKGLESSMGEEIVCIRNPEDYEKLSITYPAAKEWLFEEFISESYGRDLRFYSIRGKLWPACSADPREISAPMWLWEPPWNLPRSPLPSAPLPQTFTNRPDWIFWGSICSLAGRSLISARSMSCRGWKASKRLPV